MSAPLYRPGQKAQTLPEYHDINVTPFIDVMLVLLIIFMVAAPLATVDVPVDLPAAAATAMPKPDAPVVLTLQADGTLVLQETPVDLDTLGDALLRLTEGERDEPVFLRADTTVDYGDLMRLMNTLRAAGYLKIALVGLEEPMP